MAEKYEGAVPGVVIPTDQDEAPSVHASGAATNPLHSAVQEGMQGFRSKPAQSGVLVGSILLLLFLIISAWTAWWGFRSEDYSTGTTTAHQLAQFMPLTAEVCTFEKGRERTEDLDGVICSSIQLVVVRKRFDYFRRAGGVAFAFIFLSTVLAIPAAFVSYVRRRGRLYYDIPEPLWFLRMREATPALFGLVSLFTLLAWASYAGVVQKDLSEDDLVAAFSGAQKLKRAGYRAGFVLAVLCTLGAAALASLAYVFHDEGEAERAAQDAAMAHAVAAGAVGQGARGGGGVGQQLNIPSSMAALPSAGSGGAAGAAAPPAPFPPAGVPPTAQGGGHGVSGGDQHPFADGGGQDYEAGTASPQQPPPPTGGEGGGRSTLNPVAQAAAGAGGLRGGPETEDDSVGNPFGEEPAL